MLPKQDFFKQYSSKTNLKPIEENQSSNQKTYYENVYSDQKSEIHFERNFDDYYIKRLLGKFNLNKESKILEIGCGNGIFTKNLVDLEAHVTAIDISEKAIDSVCQKFEKKIKEGKAVFHCADLNEFLGKDSKNLYTHIVGGGILHHIQNLSETLKLIEKNLQNEGSILFAPEPNASGFYGMLWKHFASKISSYFDANFNWEIEKGTLNITIKNLNSLLTEAGFKNIQIVPYKVIPNFRLQFVHKINMKLVQVDRFSSVALYLAIYAKSV